MDYENPKVNKKNRYLTVRDLIAELKKQDRNAVVMLMDTDTSDLTNEKPGAHCSCVTIVAGEVIEASTDKSMNAVFLSGPMLQNLSSYIESTTGTTDPKKLASYN